MEARRVFDPVHIAILLIGLVYYKSSRALPLLLEGAISALDFVLAFGQDLALLTLWLLLVRLLNKRIARRRVHGMIARASTSALGLGWLAFGLFNTHYHSLFGIPLNMEALADVQNPMDFSSSASPMLTSPHTIFAAGLATIWIWAWLRAGWPAWLVTLESRAYSSSWLWGAAAAAGLWLTVVPSSDPYSLRRSDVVEFGESVVRVFLEDEAAAYDSSAALELGSSPRPESFFAPKSIISPAEELVALQQRFERAQAEQPLNVVFVVLETMVSPTTAARNDLLESLPTLMSFEQNSLVFTDYSTVFPLSMKSLVTLFCSIHPYPQRKTLTEVNPRLDCRSVSETFASQGYRAGLFHSGRFSYSQKDQFFSGRKLEVMIDADNNPLSSQYRGDRWGIQEEATLERMFEWIDEERPEPMLLLYIPVAGHHPFRVYDQRYRSNGAMTRLQRYKNVLRYVDDSVRSLVEGFESRGLMDQTLFIFVGDHGAGLDLHPNNWIHSAEIFEENVQTMAYWYQPRLIPKRIAYHEIVQHPDHLPSLYDLIGFEIPDRHEGVSIFRSYPRKPAIHYTVRSKYLAALREGPIKVIANLRDSTTMTYNLSNDPSERHGRSATRTAFSRHTQRFFVDFVPRRKHLIETYPRIAELE